jgi:hypothetical protein
MKLIVKIILHVYDVCPSICGFWLHFLYFKLFPNEDGGEYPQNKVTFSYGEMFQCSNGEKVVFFLLWNLLRI